MKIDNYSKAELLNLKSDIDRQLEIVEQNEIDSIRGKESVRTKNKLSELTNKDKIFSILLWNKDNSVHDADWCDIESCNGLRINISHKTKSLGLSTSIGEEDANKHYYLLELYSTTHFLTMKPETWEEDLNEALKEKIVIRKQVFNKDIEKLKTRIKSAFKQKNKINLNLC